MSGLDDLPEAARNRGLKLVRSRVRTPGKRRFGKAGLTDAAGKPVFGMDEKGPNAKPEEVAKYLRDLAASDWTKSVGMSKVRKHTRMPAEPPPKTPKPPKPGIRTARPADVRGLVGLMESLGVEATAAGVRKRLAALLKSDAPPLVATLDKAVVGLAGLHIMTAIHRDPPVGRINILVVSPDLRGQGLGRRLVEASIERLREHGCGLVEVTSNDRLVEAHKFYRHLGFEQTSRRFCKEL